MKKSHFFLFQKGSTKHFFKNRFDLIFNFYLFLTDSTSGPIHVLTSNPICLYSMKPHAKSIQFLDLYDIFPGLGPKPIAIATLGEQLAGKVILHEQIVRIFFSSEFNFWYMCCAYILIES